MFPEFVPDKLMWVIAVTATVAVMVSRAHAERSPQGFHSGPAVVSLATANSGNWR